MAVQFSVALSVRVTGSPAIGADVLVLVSVADTVVATLYSPVAALHLERGRDRGGGATTATVAEALEAR